MAREEDWKTYRRTALSELRPWVPGEALDKDVTIQPQDAAAGSPKPGDMIARDPRKRDHQWLVSKEYFEANFEPINK